MDLDDHVHGNGVVLCARCSGRWDIFTSSGTVYRVDLDRSIVVRTPPSKQFLTRDCIAVELRKDQAPLPMIRMAPVKIGEPAVLLLASVSDDPAWEWTVRPTTPVIMVEPYQSPNSLKKGDPA